MERNVNPARPHARAVALALGGMTLAAAVSLSVAAPAGASGSRPEAFVRSGTLTVVGTGRGESLALRLASGDPATLEVDFGDDGSAERRFDRATFGEIEVSLKGGNDRFRVDQVNGAFADEALKVAGGRGNDTLDGGDGAEEFQGGSGNDAVDGNRGDDTGILGSGRDSFRWDPGDGSDVVEGRSGTDTLDFNGAAAAEVMSLAPNGGRSLFLRDLGNIRMDMDGVERLDLTALGGVDTVTVEDMSGTDLRRADVDLQGPAGGGDGAADTVTVRGTDRRDEVDVEADGDVVEVEGLRVTTALIGAEPTDTLRVEARGGNDDVDVERAAEDLVQVLVDLGAGQR